MGMLLKFIISISLTSSLFYLRMIRPRTGRESKLVRSDMTFSGVRPVCLCWKTLPHSVRSSTLFLVSPGTVLHYPLDDAYVLINLQNNSSQRNIESFLLIYFVLIVDLSSWGNCEVIDMLFQIHTILAWLTFFSCVIVYGSVRIKLQQTIKYYISWASWCWWSTISRADGIYCQYPTSKSWQL